MSEQEDKEKEALVTRSSLPPYKEYIEMMKPIWDSAWSTNMGDFHKQLEKELRGYMGIRSMVLFINGYTALEMVTQALELTGRMIITPFNSASTTRAIVRNNLTPVFCDINPEDYTMDPERIEALIIGKASVIMLAHVYGGLCDAERVEAIARKYGLKTIYGTVHTFGERCKGKSVAELGGISIPSFHTIKVFSPIERGAVTFKEDWMEYRLSCPKNFRIVDQDHAIQVDGSARMNEFQAAVGLCNLHHLDREIGEHKKVVERYLSGLTGAPGIELLSFKEGLTPNYAYFPVFLENFKAGRDQVYDCLTGHRIYSRKYLHPLISDFQCYESRFSSKSTPMIACVAGRVLTLSCYIDLMLEDVDHICGIIRGTQEANMDKVLPVIPAFNEERNIEGVVEDLARGFPYPDYVVVSDGSRDSIVKIRRNRRYNLLGLPVNLGLAGYFQAGMEYTYRKGYRYAIQFDEDGQCRPEYIETMRQEIEEGYDIVIGSRFATEEKGWLARMIGNRVIGSAIRPTTGTRVTGPTSGMRILNRKIIGEFTLNLNYGPEPDTASFLVRRGAGVAELQVTIDERLEGESYLKPPTAIHYMARILTSTLMVQSLKKRQYWGMFENCFSDIPGAWRTS